MAYIVPRKRKDKESAKEELSRRIEESIEFYYNCGRMSEVSLFEDVLKYIDQTNDPNNEYK